MAQCRFLTGLFLKIEGGHAYEDFETLPTGTIPNLPPITGTYGCDLDTGLFYDR